MAYRLQEAPHDHSVVIDTYGRAGNQVKRSQNEDSLTDENALTATAFFIGGHSFDWRMERGNLPSGEKFGRRVEDFLARGGRVVLVAAAGKLKSESQGWEIGSKWNQTPHESRPTWISPDPSAMPAGT